MIKFREWLLLEMPMRTEADLPEGVYVYIRSFSKSATIKLSDANGRRLYVDRAGGITTQETDQWLGEMQIAKVKEQTFWSVKFVQAKRGFGPLLYDLAMEYATLRGAGLTADLTGPISTSAHDVWEKYAWARSDVERTPLPSQFHRELPDHPISYVYTKNPERAQQLRTAGRLIEK